MYVRINVPWLFHFQSWTESRKSRPFVELCKEENTLYIGQRMLQLNKSEGNFFLVEVCVLSLEIGVILGAFTGFKMGFITRWASSTWPA